MSSLGRGSRGEADGEASEWTLGAKDVELRVTEMGHRDRVWSEGPMSAADAEWALWLWWPMLEADRWYEALAMTLAERAPA